MYKGRITARYLRKSVIFPAAIIFNFFEIFAHRYHLANGVSFGFTFSRI